MEEETQNPLQVIFDRIDTLPVNEAELGIASIKNEFERMAKIKLAEIKHRKNVESLTEKASNQTSLTQNIAQTQLPAERISPDGQTIIG